MTTKKGHITAYRNAPPSEDLSNLRWDNNGNLAQQTIYSVNNNVPTYLNMRMLFWDEDDHLNLVAGDGYLSYYAYGHDGNRAIKMTGNAAIDQNGTLTNTGELSNITIYPSEYLTVTQAEYTKYYYAGGNRIASKIGTGGFGKMQQLCTLDQSLTANTNTLFDNILQQTVNTTNQPTDEYPVTVCGGYNIATELLTSALPDFYISNTALNFTQNNLLQQFRQNLTGGTEAVYYFHSDHLGSASWITDGSGLPVQHLLYLPFGEHFANEHSSGYDERFTFTGKERDAETGYYYHGARFNSSDIGWLSVDPMADKYPSMTPYNYCAWNPIKLVDPTGNEAMDIDDWYKNTETGAVLWQEGHAKQIKVGGYTYDNIGESYSQPTGDGKYVNYFQNYPLTIGPEHDVTDMAYCDKSTRTKLIRRDSPLPNSHKIDLFASNVASRGISTPDMVGLQFSANLFIGGGLSVDVGVGIIKGDGIYGSFSLSPGSGYDFSASVGLCSGHYNGSDAPSKDNFRGLSYNVSAGAGSIFYQHSTSDLRGNGWNVSTHGVSMGSGTFLGGSYGVSYSWVW